MWVSVSGHGWGPAVRCLLVGAALGSIGCGNTERNGTGLATGGSAATSGGQGGTGGTGGVTTAGAAGDGLEARPSELHRLNGREYRATVEDVLGTPLGPFQVREGEAGGFDNAAAVLSIDSSTYQTFLDVAELVAEQVFTSPMLKARVVTCTAQDDTPCVRNVIEGVGLRLFRRPLLDSEPPVYEKVYAAARERGDLHDAALEQVLVALLASAQFLYRMEFVGDQAGTVPVSQYELASRLSYLLWSSAPDAQLLSAAERNELSEDDQLAAQFARMLDDDKSTRFVESFAGQWLGARRLADHPTSPEVYPEWSVEVASAAADEVYASFDELLRKDTDYLDLFSSTVRFVNGPLATIYDIELPGTGVQRLDFDTHGRAGYLGSAAFLTMTSLDRRTSPTLRGRSILIHLLCLELDPPSADIPVLDPEPAPEEATLREKVEHISDTPECAACHRLMDPLGLALENYDGIGRYRTEYEDGSAIDANVTLDDGTAVSGLPDVIEWVRKQPTAPRCALQKAYAYSLGRAPDDVDARNIDALSRAWQAGPRTFKAALRSVVLSKPFRYRSDGGRP
jgi:hypothetical protein